MKWKFALQRYFRWSRREITAGEVYRRLKPVVAELEEKYGKVTAPEFEAELEARTGIKFKQYKNYRNHPDPHAPIGDNSKVRTFIVEMRAADMVIHRRRFVVALLSAIAPILLIILVRWTFSGDHETPGQLPAPLPTHQSVAGTVSPRIEADFVPPPGEAPVAVTPEALARMRAIDEGREPQPRIAIDLGAFGFTVGLGVPSKALGAAIGANCPAVWGAGQGRCTIWKRHEHALPSQAQTLADWSAVSLRLEHGRIASAKIYLADPYQTSAIIQNIFQRYTALLGYAREGNSLRGRHDTFATRVERRAWPVGSGSAPGASVDPWLESDPTWDVGVTRLTMTIDQLD